MGKAKTGPKRKDVPRTPSGQPSRSAAAKQETAEEILATGLRARERVHGVSKGMARSQMAGYPVGRLCLAGRWDRDGRYSLSPEQHDALLAFALLRQRYLVAIGAKKGVASPALSEMVSSGSFSWTLGDDDQREIDRTAAVRSRYADARSAICNLGEGALAVVVRVASDERDPSTAAEIVTLGQAANLLLSLWTAKHRRAA